MILYLVFISLDCRQLPDGSLTRGGRGPERAVPFAVAVKRRRRAARQKVLVPERPPPLDPVAGRDELDGDGGLVARVPLLHQAEVVPGARVVEGLATGCKVTQTPRSRFCVVNR